MVVTNKDQIENEIPPKALKKTLAFVQILRLGDILQTIKMAQELRVVHGDKFKLLLIARKSFATPLRELIDSVFDECITIDLKDLTLKGDSVSLENTLKNIKELKAKINSNVIEVCINLSFSKSANYLMSLIHANNKIGPTYDEQANIRIKDKWSQYLYANVLETNQNPFNLVDLFKLIVGVDHKQGKKEKIEFTPRKKVFIHPFTSDSKKRWNESKWVEIIYKFLKDHENKEVFIVGSDTDNESANKITNNPLLKTFNDRLENICGKYSINELKNLLDEESMFIGHDSMVSHLASLQNVPIITISLGTVRPYETTPYIEGVYNLSPKTKCFPCKPDTSCDFFQCHADIPYQVVNESLSIISKGIELTQENLKENLSHFHLNSTEIRKSEFNSAGLLTLNTVFKEDMTYNETLNSFYTLAWTYLFNEIVVNQDYPKISDKTHSLLAKDMQGLQQLYELSEFGKKYSRYILEEVSTETPDIQKIKEHSNKVDEIDRLCDIISETYPQLRPLINFGTISRANLHGENLVELTESSFYSFHDLSNATSIIYELCEKTLTKNQISKSKTNNEVSIR
ncbi:hypothetical protein A9Q84_21225 [Halobacteriovorax marinus]|uniref:Heptosyltransferase n=1 Tax=Halobacteriovorax marinus TaxID=97084 RepID=A0A1Y5F1K0_9BACT|nr:hypothetical protein A9Q84_21225 [Halobacteriovorax marinus]